MENSYELAKRCEHDCREVVNLGEEGKDLGKIFEMNMGAVHIISAHIYVITAQLQRNTTAQCTSAYVVTNRFEKCNQPTVCINLSVPLRAFNSNPIVFLFSSVATDHPARLKGQGKVMVWWYLTCQQSQARYRCV